MTECSADSRRVASVGQRDLVAQFDGGRISSDGGAVALRALDDRLGLLDRLAGCFVDYRDPQRIDHSVRTLVGQRVLGLALGYEDLNDHQSLRSDPLLAAVLGVADVEGERRVHDADRGHALAGKSTLNRLELTDAASASPAERYKKIAADVEAIDALLVDFFIDAHPQAPERIVLDLDATDDPLHGEQQQRFFHGYYGHHCYLPLYIFCGRYPLCARLRHCRQDEAAGSCAELERIVTRIRQHWPDVAIVIRADSGFCRDWLMSWCEHHDVDYVLGIARNARLEAMLAAAMEGARHDHEQSGCAARRFQRFRYRTRQSWSRERQVVGKAEYLAKGPNPRFIVTSLDVDDDGRALYEQLYCARGEMENRIKEQQLALFADRTSSHTMQANQLRLYLSTFGYCLLQALREHALGDTAFADSRCDTIRLQLLKIGARIRVTARRIWVSLSSSYPHQTVILHILDRLRAPAAIPI